MLSNIWNTVLYEPLVNALAFLVSVIPGGDMGLAVIILTIIVKFLLLPLSHRSIASQAGKNNLPPQLLKKKKKGGKQKKNKRLFPFDQKKTKKKPPPRGPPFFLIFWGLGSEHIHFR